MRRFYSRAGQRAVGAAQQVRSLHRAEERALSPVADKFLQLFQMNWGLDKIARRDVNRANKRLFLVSLN
jgi:hypothetical protein